MFIPTSGMVQRSEVVLSVLGELQEATESPGLDALTTVALEVDRVLASLSLPNTPCHEFPDWTGIDRMAHSLYPADAPGGLLPLVCKGEGNLLFDAASMMLVGTTSISMELQVRTVVEMLLWKRYYLCGMIDSKVMIQAARFSLCAEESEEMLNLPMTVLEAIFDADIKASCFPGSFANMWHVYALSSVLRCNIYSVYPMFNFKIRPYFNRLIRPRTCPKNLDPVTIHIMWSGELQYGSVFKPHHFVALVKASDLRIGSPNSSQRARPLKTLELLNQDVKLSYSSLKDNYNIPKSTFYRWKRQTQEHRKKSAVRYEAKQVLQASYLQGNLIPFLKFKEFFPEISRSTFSAWKHELLLSGGSFSGSSAGEVSPGESTEQETWSSPEGKHEKPDQHDSVAGLFGLNSDKLEGERAQTLAHMQEAKRCLQNCIAMNTSFPFRLFKRNFPGISRSTYYNWRREAMLFNRGYKAGSSEESSDPDKSQSPKNGLTTTENHAAVSRGKIWRRSHRGFKVNYLLKKKFRDTAKLRVQKLKWSLSKFKLNYPSLSPSFYWRWRGRSDRTRNLEINPEMNTPEAQEVRSTETGNEMTENAVRESRMDQSVFSFEESPEGLKGSIMTQFDPPVPRYTLPSKVDTDKQMFVMDVVALANFKAKAKLFLQQRFEEKSFPTFKEFRSYFPLTPRSTFYMWKRALHHGLPLVHV
ncbi:vertnin [Osmerus mordax]|uniref:vertnin n=1 Tax=Osmerus mordax TaxID=8014 RepID=UPI00351024F1